jgi:hypothetical protein
VISRVALYCEQTVMASDMVICVGCRSFFLPHPVCLALVSPVSSHSPVPRFCFVLFVVASASVETTPAIVSWCVQ